MKKIVVGAFVLFSALSAKAQFVLPTDLGQGFISIKISWVPIADTAKMDTAHHTFMTFDYHVDHDKVFRKGKQSSLFLDSSKKTSVLPNKAKMESSFRADVVIPTYLIDWKNKTVFTYFTKQGKVYLSEDSLAKNSDEMFYKSIFLHKKNKHFLIDTSGQKPIIIAGIPCYSAFYRHPNQRNWLRFVYTTQQLSVYSPINGFFDADFPFPILRIDVENQVMVKDTLKTVSVFRMEVITVNNDSPNPDFFQLPKNIPILKQVPNSEMYINP